MVFKLVKLETENSAGNSLVVKWLEVGFSYAWALKKGDYWYSKDRDDRPLLWFEKSVGEHSAHVAMFCGRLALGISWKRRGRR